MGKKSPLGVYRSLEVELDEVRKLHAKDKSESPDETALITKMDEVWYQQLSPRDRATLSKES